jgi:hypothetical protein
VVERRPFAGEVYLGESRKAEEGCEDNTTGSPATR